MPVATCCGVGDIATAFARNELRILSVQIFAGKSDSTCFRKRLDVFRGWENGVGPRLMTVSAGSGLLRVIFQQGFQDVVEASYAKQHGRMG